PHDPDFVPEPIYLEYIPLEDEQILLAEEQPLPPIVSPTVESPGYVDESNPEEDPEKYEEDETEDGPVGYHIDGGDDGDDDDIDSSRYDADNEDEDEEDEVEYLALADSTTVIPIDELASPPKGIEQIMAPVTRQGQNPPPPNTNTPPHHMTPESVHAMIDQALLRNSTNGDGSQSSHEDNPRHVQTTRPCFYADFMKCHPLNFKGNEGVVGLTRWIEKIQIRTLGPEAYAMTWEVLKKKMTDKSSGNANVVNAQRNGKETPKGNGCFECGASGHFKRDCQKLKNKNGGNRNAQGWVYAVGNVEKNKNAPVNPDSNVVTGTLLLNYRYASILFDTGADRSFISIAFSSL
nr:hypothetical protein [Tanacetum cinerariifolium]